MLENGDTCWKSSQCYESISFRSHALAKSQSLLTVTTEMASALPVSLSLNPPKYLSSTTKVRAGGMSASASGCHRSDSGPFGRRKFVPGGTIGMFAGTGAADFSGDGGPANRAALNIPSGSAVDIAGNVCVSDTGNNRIRKISTDGTIRTFAGQTDATDPGGVRRNVVDDREGRRAVLDFRM